MNVSLTPALDNYVHLKVKSGRYNSASEVVREALRIMQDQEQLKDLMLAEVRQMIEGGLVDLDSGNYVEGNAADLMEGTLARGRAKIAARQLTGE